MLLTVDTEVRMADGTKCHAPVRRSLKLAQDIALPVQHGFVQHARANPILMPVSDIVNAVPSLPWVSLRSDHRRRPIVVWSIPTKAELARCVVEVSADCPEARKKWAFLRSGTLRSDPRRSSAFILAASRTRGRAEGIIAAWRRTIVVCNGRKPIKAEYELGVEFFFVAPKARRKLVGAGLKACLCQQSDDDMQYLCDVLESDRNGLPLSRSVCGEVASLDGERMLKDIYSRMRRFEPTTFRLFGWVGLDEPAAEFD